MLNILNISDTREIILIVSIISLLIFILAKSWFSKRKQKAASRAVSPNSIILPNGNTIVPQPTIKPDGFWKRNYKSFIELLKNWNEKSKLRKEKRRAWRKDSWKKITSWWKNWKEKRRLKKEADEFADAEEKRAKQEKIDKSFEDECLKKEEKKRLQDEAFTKRQEEMQKKFEEELKKPFDILGIAQAIETRNEQYINTNMLGSDVTYVELPVKNIKCITTVSGKFVKLIMNWPGKCFDKDWNIVDEDSPLRCPEKNYIGPNETMGRRYIGPPNINMVVEYSFSWDTYLSSNKDGSWNVKTRKDIMVKQALCEAFYFMVFMVKTTDGYSVLIAVQFKLKVVNGFNVYYGASSPGKWINGFHSKVYSVFSEHGLKFKFKDLEADIAKPDAKSNIGERLQRDSITVAELIAGTGHIIEDFDIMPLYWDRTDPMFVAYEDVTKATQKKLTVIQEQEAEDKKNEVSAKKIERDKKAGAAGDKDLLLTEQEFVKEISKLPAGKEIIEAHYLSKMTNLLSYSKGGEKSDLTLIKNVDDAKGSKKDGSKNNDVQSPPVKQ